MDQYHIWVDLKDSSKDLEFAKAIDAWLGMLKEKGLLESYRLSRRKLGFGPAELGEFHVLIETRDLAQLEEAFQVAARREGRPEAAHHAVYSMVTNFRAGLWRDFPDPVRAGRA